MIEYKKDGIVQSYITDYIRSELCRKDDTLSEIERFAAENSIPVAVPETVHLLMVLSRIISPANVLEIGCAVGYSAIAMSRGLRLGGQITTIEYDADTAADARENIAAAGLSDTITVVTADAKQYVRGLNGVYDMIFLDGPKAHYIYMLDDLVRLLRSGGVLIADNVLYKGMTASDSLLIHRKITIVRRLRRFIHEINTRKDLITSILPVGDGVTVSVKV